MGVGARWVWLDHLDQERKWIHDLRSTERFPSRCIFRSINLSRSIVFVTFIGNEKWDQNWSLIMLTRKGKWFTDMSRCRCLTADWWWLSRSSPAWSSACSSCWPTSSTSGAMCSSKTLLWVNSITLNKRYDVKGKKTKQLLYYLNQGN